jgi:hypothetical protein
MQRPINILISVAIIVIVAAPTWAVQMGKESRRHTKHSYHQTKLVKKEKALPPEIIHNPIYEIPSTENFNITAEIKNISLGLPIVFYRFGDDKHFFKRALKKTDSGAFSLEILSAALTDNKVDYYIELSTGSKSLANYGTKEIPVSVEIIHPTQSTSIFYAALLVIGIIVTWKVVATQKAYYKAEKKKETQLRMKFKKKNTVRAVR